MKKKTKHQAPPMSNDGSIIQLDEHMYNKHLPPNNTNNNTQLVDYYYYYYKPYFTTSPTTTISVTEPQQEEVMICFCMGKHFGNSCNMIASQSTGQHDGGERSGLMQIIAMSIHIGLLSKISRGLFVPNCTGVRARLIFLTCVCIIKSIHP